MKERIISGAIMTIIAVIVFLLGGIVFDIAIGILAVLAFKELLEIKKDVEIPFLMKIMGLISMALLIYSNIDDHSILFGLSYEMLSVVFLLLLAPTVFYKGKKYTVTNSFYLSTCAIFLGTVFNLFINVFAQSKIVFIFLLLISCITDIFALLGGKLIGKHKLTKISPNKTIEGSVTGTIFAVIIATTFHATLINSVSVIKLVPLIIILSVIGQIGDLFFSLIKRENDVKDFSNLIPGHGGILDRIDSFIFVIITYVFLVQFL